MRYEEEDTVTFVLSAWASTAWNVLSLSLTSLLLYGHVSVMQLLSKPKFSSVEKIKTIGSTYMAAAGLTLPAPGDERKVCSLFHGSECFCLFLKRIDRMF